MNELIKKLEILLKALAELKQHLSLPQKEQKILELEDRMQAPDFWADNQSAQKVAQEYKQLKDFYGF